MSWPGGIGAAILIAISLAGASSTAPGDLDPSFGDQGRVLLSISPYGALTTAADVQPDGKIVLAGYTSPWAPGGANRDFVAVRLNPDGSVDHSFGIEGVRKVPIDLQSSGRPLRRLQSQFANEGSTEPGSYASV